MKANMLLLILCAILSLSSCTTSVPLEQLPATIEMPATIAKKLIDCYEEMGVDSLPVMNECEAACLNYYFRKRRGNFDFSGKRVIFFRGNWGRNWVPKSIWFDHVKWPYRHASYFPDAIEGQLIILDEDQSRLYGYDAAIVNASIPRVTKKVIGKRIKATAKNLSL